MFMCDYGRNIGVFYWKTIFFRVKPYVENRNLQVILKTNILKIFCSVFASFFNSGY